MKFTRSRIVPGSSLAALVLVASFAGASTLAVCTDARADDTLLVLAPAPARTLDETINTLIVGEAAPAQASAPAATASSGASGSSDPPIEVSSTAFKPRFGEMDSFRLNILLGYANDFDDTQLFGGGVGLSWFFVDNLSLDLEFTGLGIEQPGPNTAGGDVSLIFRWHFLVRERWSLYFEGGAGVLWTTSDVPEDGTSFNFTPQVGFGLTYDLGDDVRLLLGARWYHISNARLSTDNPGINSAMVYVGVSLPL